MAGEFVPRKAEKRSVKLKIGVQGPSGSGKTWGALVLARNMWPDARICVIDTENESASLYADRWDFDTIPLHEPFTTARYNQAIDAVIEAGYDVVIIDSITPQWDGVGGILRRKEELDKRPGSNSYTNWASFTPEHESFKQKLQQSPIHLIATMRSKQEYALQQDEKGRSKPVKIGLAPIQRDGMDYEFSLVWDVQMDHRAVVSKNRTGLFDGEVLNLSDPKVAKTLRAWLENGKHVEAPPPNPTAPANTTKSTSAGETSSTASTDGEIHSPDLDKRITTDQARELSQMALVGKPGGVDKDALSAYMASIGYKHEPGIGVWYCVTLGQYELLKKWIVEHKK